MGFIIMMVNTFVFCMCTGAVVGIVLSIVIVIPLMIYIAPYSIWIAFKQHDGKYRNVKDEHSLRLIAKNATKLYVSWIARREPTF